MMNPHATTPAKPRSLWRDAANWLARRHPALARHRFADAIRRNAPRQMANAGVPGLQVSFVFGGGEATTLCLGVASRSGTENITPAHRFRLGSISKPVAAIVHLLQVERGTLTLDETLRDELQVLCPHLSRDFVDRVTPRLLLSHAAGLAASHPPRTNPQISCIDWLSNPQQIRFEARPGEVSAYTSAGYGMLEAIIERRTGQSFARLARETLLDPLALQTTGFEDSRGDDLGRSELICDDHGADGNVLRWLPTASVSSSGVISSTRDVCTLVRDAMLTKRFLRDDSRSELLAAQPRALQSAHFTLGLHLYKGHDARSLGHGGHRLGHRSMIVVVPVARAVLCVAANSENGDVVMKHLTGLFRAITIGK